MKRFSHTVKEKHEHDFSQLVLIKIMADNPGYNGMPMGILARKCECGAKEPFEYGTREDMTELANRIKAKQ